MLKNRGAFNNPLKIATNLQIREKKLEQKQVKKLDNSQKESQQKPGGEFLYLSLELLSDGGKPAKARRKASKSQRASQAKARGRARQKQELEAEVAPGQ